ncbi:MAG: molybdopterin molybdotransferase MoeA [Alphaproteobacteria bacterium]|nr:molybdopterin molybdotransferase MoeA [Alphaproteobacteria bacterium]
MAQLYDCFAKGGLLPLADIYALIADLDGVQEVETLTLADTLNQNIRGRLLAKNIIAPFSVPSFANAAVDGYAFRHQDYQQQMAVSGKAEMQLIATIEAGDRSDIALQKNQAVLIFTGAAMPKHADMVVMLEDIAENRLMLAQKISAGEQPMITIPDGLKQYDNYRPIGDDVAETDVILHAGDALTPPMLAMLAALNIKQIPVIRQLKVGILSNGDELMRDDDMLTYGKIYDANRPLLKKLLASYGVLVTDYGIMNDDKQAIKAVFEEATKTQDLLISSGGMSEGGKDYIRALLQDDSPQNNGKLCFLRAAIKPGRPVGIGYWRDMPIIGLPGNPVAAFTVFLAIALPMLMRLQGHKTTKLPLQFQALADFNYQKRPQRTEYVRVKLMGHDTKTHLPILARYGKKGAGVLSSLLGADGFAVLEGDNITKGMQISYMPFEQFF